MTLVSTFFAQVDQHPDRIAIVEPGGARVTYGQLAHLVGAHAAYYRRIGVGAGDRVLVTLKVEIALYASLYALWSLGAVVVFPEPSMGVTGLRHAAGIRLDAWLAPALWRAIGKLYPELRRVPRGISPPPRVSAQAHDEAAARAHAATVGDDDAALIFFTSGSTGKPKAIVYTHTFIMDQARGLTPLFTPHPGEVDLVAFPLFVLACLDLGSTNVLPNWDLRKPRAARLDRILGYARGEGVTRMLLQPALCEALVREEVPPTVRAVLTGGGPVFPDLLRRLAEKVPVVFSVYGSTEAEPIAHIAAAEIAPADWAEMTAGGGILTGAPAIDVQVRIVDDEIQVTGPNVNKGYLDPSRNASTKQIDADGVIWHRTGDAGRIDDRGRIWLLGRLEGRVGKLFPFSVEAMVRLWPRVTGAALGPGPDGQPVLAIAGDASALDDWRRRARAIGIDRVFHLDELPLDRRHASKVEYVRLREVIRKLAPAR